MTKDKKDNESKSWLLYGGLAIAGVYGLYKLPFLRKLVMPAVIGAATKYLGDYYADKQAEAKT